MKKIIYSLIIFSGLTLNISVISAAEQLKAFEGAMGWSALTAGGRGGKIVRVTNLGPQGPGSLQAAVAVEGPRIVVFEVGGVIDLQKHSLVIREPYLTIAGQTAPNPGITLIRGGLVVSAHDVIIRHLRVRPGDTGAAKKAAGRQMVLRQPPIILLLTIVPAVGQLTRILLFPGLDSAVKQLSNGVRILPTGLRSAIVLLPRA